MATILFVCSLLVFTGSTWALPLGYLTPSVGIINPNYTDISTRSFTVAITIGMDLLGGGTLVSQRWVLTTASVVQGFNISHLRVRLGSNSSFEGGKLHKMKQIVYHPLYKPGNATFDLAMVRMDRNVTYSVARHISFLARVPFTSDYAYATVTGYGQYRPGGSGQEGSDEQNLQSGNGLQIAEIKIHNHAYCNYLGPPTTQFCGWQRVSPLCDGDAGDPVVRCATDRRCQLVGVYTGYNKCQAYGQGFFMDIGQFRDWIKSVIRPRPGAGSEYVSWMDSDEEFNEE